MPTALCGDCVGLTATIPVLDGCGISGCVLQGIVRRQPECLRSARCDVSALRDHGRHKGCPRREPSRPQHSVRVRHGPRTGDRATWRTPRMRRQIHFEGSVANIARDWSMTIRTAPPGPPRRIDGYTIEAIPNVVGPGPHGGEVHPDGDEFLYLVTSAMELILTTVRGNSRRRDRRFCCGQVMPTSAAVSGIGLSGRAQLPRPSHTRPDGGHRRVCRTRAEKRIRRPEISRYWTGPGWPRTPDLDRSRPPR